jgi:hypothetical protein
MGFSGEHYRTCQPDVRLLHDIFDNMFQIMFSSGDDDVLVAEIRNKLFDYKWARRCSRRV